MPIVLGKGVKLDKVEKTLAKHQASMIPGEEVWFWAKCNNFKPMVDAVVVTNARLIGLSNIEGPKFTVLHGDIATTEENSKKGTYTVSALDTRSVTFKAVPSEDVPKVSHYVEYGRSVPMPDSIRAGIESQTLAAEAVEQAKAEQEGREVRARERSWPDTRLVGQKISEKASLAVLRQCHDDEEPWLILGAGTMGVLAAFEDRLAIIKTGAMTGLMAGSLGGERSGTFHFRDITGVEYNSGFLNGVLEVLTPSYTGTATHDYWGKGDKDPWKLSNCLPLPKADFRKVEADIRELRSKISQSKQMPAPQVIVAPADSAGGGLADEVRKLAELHEAGILTADEFAAAKARLLS